MSETSKEKFMVVVGGMGISIEAENIEKAFDYVQNCIVTGTPVTNLNREKKIANLCVIPPGALVQIITEHQAMEMQARMQAQSNLLVPAPATHGRRGH